MAGPEFGELDPRGGMTSFLIQAAKTLDTGALDRILRRFSPLLRSIVLNHLGPYRFRNEGEELLQDINLRVLRRFPGFLGNDTRSLVAWLRKVAWSECIDRDRRRLPKGSRGGKVSLSATDAPEVAWKGETPSRELCRQEDLDRIAIAVHRVPEKYQRVLHLHYFQNVTDLSELAKEMGMGADACRKHKALAMRKLRQAYEALDLSRRRPG